MSNERFSDQLNPGDHLKDAQGLGYRIVKARPRKASWEWEFLCHRASDDREMWVNAGTIDQLHEAGTLTRTFEANPVHCQPA